ncbi:cobalt-precorrin-6x reductase [uncultured Blautia sp.]|nr:cobalt-precorrin-6x reductase [uncultured Blautia sp.]
MQGPFSQELNEALIRQYHIAWVVTKDGGTAGGFPEKARAAETTGAELIVLCRPEDQGEDLASIVKLCEEMMR